MNVGIHKRESNNHGRMEEKKERTKLRKVFMMNKEVLLTINLFKDL